MKKLTLICFVMCICFFTASSQSSLQESINVAKQEEIDIFQFSHPDFIDIKDDMSKRTDTENIEWNISDILVSGKSKGLFNHQVSQLDSLIQIMDSNYYWKWDANINGWKIDARDVEMLYDNNNMTSLLRQQWNGIEWENALLIAYTYDANNNMTNLLYQQWNGIEWENALLIAYTYDANNIMKSYFSQQWNGSDWENLKRYTYSYDANNNWASYLSQNWNGSYWENYFRYTYTIDANNNMIIRLSQEWNGSDWENSSRHTYIYNANNNPISDLLQKWNGLAWENFSQGTYSYDMNNNETGYFNQLWNDGEWVNGYLWTNTYDANNNPTSYFSQQWNGSDWVNNVQITYSYDENNFTLSYSSKRWDDTGNSIIYGDSTYYYFHTGYMGTDDLIVSTGSIFVYPNPSSDQITIDLPNKPQKNTLVTIYNLNSQKEFTRQIREQQTVVDVSMFLPGVYIVEVVADGTRATQKLIIL